MPRSYAKKDKPLLKVVTVNITEDIVIYVKQMVKFGLIPSRSEWFRQAAIEKVKQDMKFKDQLQQELNDNEKILSFIEEPMKSVIHNGKQYKILSNSEKNYKLLSEAEKNFRVED